MPNPKTAGQHIGLTSSQVAEKLHRYGRNEITRVVSINPFQILIRQFSSPLIIILLLAAVISYAVGLLPNQEPKTIDAILILIIVLVSGILGFVQDYQAEKTIEALQEMSTPRSKVIRDGHEQEIASVDIVPEDLLVIESGDMITADGKVVGGFQLEVDESVLSGESAAVRKLIDDPVYLNSFVTGGHAQVLVERTGMNTKMGRVATKLQEIKAEKSTFQKELGSFSRKLSLFTLAITILVAAVGAYKFGFYTSMLLAISLAVAAVPEGLPAVVVLALVAGAKIMFKKNVLIRKLPIVESVGAVDIICTDKTGTLTKNEMTVTRLFYNNRELPTKDIGEAFKSDKTGQMLLKCGFLCNNVSASFDSGQELYLGEQTEIALWKLSKKYLDKEPPPSFHKVNEIAFTSERKMMSVVYEAKEGSGFTVFSKGAPEVLIQKCRHQLVQGKVLDLTDGDKQEILKQNERLASEALRVLGFAIKKDHHKQSQIEDDLVWIGLQAMIDPPRDEVSEAIKDCYHAGIRIIMITGDNPITAEAIANKVGLKTTGVILGSDLEQWDDNTLLEALNKGINIYARTTPFHKLRLLELLSSGHSVAMTGDGVNDALAIKKSEVGIAMGKKGTEVAKQASDFILLDDNFNSIRNAVKEGRTIFNNIRKFINYLLTCNLAEVGLILSITLFFGFSEPVLWPVQLLWINLLTDGLVALALGVDPASEDIMAKPPRKLREPIINSRIAWSIVLIGLQMTVLLIAVFLVVLPLGLESARSTLMTGIVLFEFVRIGAIRYEEKMKWGSNPWLVWGLFVSFILQLIILYTPLNQYFKLVPLGAFEWLILLSGALLGYYLAIWITRLIILKLVIDDQDHINN